LYVTLTNYAIPLAALSSDSVVCCSLLIVTDQQHILHPGFPSIPHGLTFQDLNILLGRFPGRFPWLLTGSLFFYATSTATQTQGLENVGLQTPTSTLIEDLLCDLRMT